MQQRGSCNKPSILIGQLSKKSNIANEMRVLDSAEFGSVICRFLYAILSLFCSHMVFLLHFGNSVFVSKTTALLACDYLYQCAVQWKCEYTKCNLTIR